MIINLSKTKNPTISGISCSGVIVNASKGNALFSTAVNTNQSSGKIVAFADQIITLYDGKILKRIKESIFIE